MGSSCRCHLHRNGDLTTGMVQTLRLARHHQRWEAGRRCRRSRLSQRCPQQVSDQDWAEAICCCVHAAKHSVLGLGHPCASSRHHQFCWLGDACPQAEPHGCLRRVASHSAPCHTAGAVAGGCKPGSLPTDVVGDALVIEDSTTPTGKALKATADCMLEGVNTYQFGGELLGLMHDWHCSSGLGMCALLSGIYSVLLGLQAGVWPASRHGCKLWAAQIVRLRELAEHEQHDTADALHVPGI